MTRMRSKKSLKGPVHFPAVPLPEVASQRMGKHGKIVAQILSDLAALEDDSALKIDLVATTTKKADLRSALHRAAKKRKLELATVSNATHLYVFRRPSSRKSA
jgi:hypothetical protein